MTVSVVGLYEKTGTNAELHTLMPVTANLEGSYRGEGVVDTGLMMLLAGYHRAEKNGRLHKINEDSNLPTDEGWALVSEGYLFADSEREEDRDYLEYGMHQSALKGYIEVEFWDGQRYYKPTEKSMNLELYTGRKEL